MPILLLRRAQSLTPLELGQLPGGCVGVRGEGDVVARATVKLGTAQLLYLAVAMARAVPDARFEVVEAETLGAPPEATPTGTEVGESAWALAEAGDLVGAARAFEGLQLDPSGRDRVRDMLQSTQPSELAMGCLIARLTGWKSAVQNMRSLVRHADATVRLEAVRAVAALAGPVMTPVLRPAETDPNPEVRAVAIAAIELWNPKPTPRAPRR